MLGLNRPLRSFRALALLGAMLGATGLAESALAANHTCPCGRIGMQKLKWMRKLTNGGKLKMYCTNKSRLGNFLLVYCPPGGGRAKAIGACIFEGGWNDTKVKKGPNGKDCFITHDNKDHGRPDGQPWDRVVWVFDIKNCKNTFHCYRRNPDGSYTEIGTPTCFGPDWYMNHTVDLNNVRAAEREFLEAIFGSEPAPEPGDPAMDVIVSIDSVNIRGGTRLLTLDAGGEDIRVLAGDRITLHGVRPTDLSNINPAFTVTTVVPIVDPVGIDAPSVPVADDPVEAAIGGPAVVGPADDRNPLPTVPIDPPAMTGVVLTATADISLPSGSPLATVSSGYSSEFDYDLVAIDEPAASAYLMTTVCAEMPTTAPIDVVTLSGGGAVPAYTYISDVDGDGMVGLGDLSLVIRFWGTSDVPCDVNEDGVVGLGDVVAILDAWDF